MNTLRRIFNLGNRSRTTGSSARFDRYYSGVIGTGTGYPTADEARKDLRSYDQSFPTYGWPR